MKRINLVFASLFWLGALAFAQGGKPAAQRNISQVLDSWVSQTEALVVPAAAAMPEEKYSFAPSDGEFKGVRTFAEQAKHLAATNYQTAAGVLGEEPPAGTRDEMAPESVKSKAEVMQYLKGSFTALHRVAAATDETTMSRVTRINGETRLSLLVDALAHSQNHYGQMVEYLRMNGIVPPESRAGK